MPEYTYLLETRLSAAQLNALTQVRDAARGAGMTVFLAGGAVRDLTTGSSVRDLDFAVQGNVLELESAIEQRGGVLWGRHEASRTLFFWFPGSVRVEVTSTRSETFPKPGKPVYTWSGIVDDLYRRDFTANAMALSLNEGSYGLLLDPLNGVADIEIRQLRLSSNYGFLEDPARLVRAVRLAHRLGWSMEERTRTRYENAKEADHFDQISPFLRGYELEKIAAEDEALGVLKALEDEGWMAKMLPGWTTASVDTSALEDLHRNRIQLLMQGISPDLSAAHLEVMTAKMKEADRTALKSTMVRPGLLTQWEALDEAAKEFGRLLTARDVNAPSASWTLFHNHPAEAILWLAHTRKGAALETKFRNFFTVWPEAAKQVPVGMMLEMRITPELPRYAELLRALFLQQIDGKLENDEQMRAFLEPYSPPAPPPPVTLRRTRSKKADAKGKKKGTTRDVDDEDEDDDDERPAARGEDNDEDDEEEDEPHADMPVELGAAKKVDFDKVDVGALLGRIQEDEDDSEDTEDGGKDDDVPAPAKAVSAKAAPDKAAPAKAASAKPAPTKAAPAKDGNSAAVGAQARSAAAPAAARTAPGKTAPGKTAAAPSAPAAPVKAKPSPPPVAKPVPVPVKQVPAKKSLTPAHTAPPAPKKTPPPAAGKPAVSGKVAAKSAGAPQKPAVPAKKPAAVKVAAKQSMPVKRHAAEPGVKTTAKAVPTPAKKHATQAKPAVKANAKSAAKHTGKPAKKAVTKPGRKH